MSMYRERVKLTVDSPEYLPYDKYLVLNGDDPDLRQIVLRLPDPPPLSFIEGYGKKPEDQRFQRMQMPRRLKLLEQEALIRVKETYEKNKSDAITLHKIQSQFWKLLLANHFDYKEEIDFIRKIWWHRIHGYWFYNMGKPTYITGWHFMYLNFWTMPTASGVNRPDYRDRDRKEFLFHKYSYECTETFTKLDEYGYAIPDDSGNYHMVDLGRRVCVGIGQPKNRRSGNTNKGLNIGLEITSRTIGTDGMGIMSYTGDNAGEAFKMKLQPAYDEFPIWLKPFTNTQRNSPEIRFDVPGNEYFERGLRTKITYASTGNHKFYDSKKLVFALLDEEGKDSENEILKRWDVVKNTLAQGNMRQIHGYSYHPSTVDEIADGAFDYRYLMDNSNFYRRIGSSGQTFSTMFRMFIPAYEGLDDFIDSYGMSVCKEIKPWQAKEGFSMTADEFLQGRRDSLLKDGTAESMRAYREERKLFPMSYSDCWLGEAGDIGFDLEKIDSRMAELRRSSNTRKGNFVWENDVFGGNVIWVDDVEKGRFELSMFPPEHIKNKKSEVMHFSTFENKMIPMFKPVNPGMFILGADPFRFANKKETQIKSKKLGSKSRLSDGGIAVLWNYDPNVDKGKSKYLWQSFKFVLSYRYRARNTEEYNEDVLKAAIFFGAMVYPETNVEETFQYFIRHKFGGYLLYDEDPMTGRLKEKPGVFNIESSKQRLFNELRDYIDTRSHVEEFASFLQECKDINGMEEMRMYDRLTSHGLCLMGSRSTYINKIKEVEYKEYDLSDYVDIFSY